MAHLSLSSAELDSISNCIYGGLTDAKSLLDVSKPPRPTRGNLACVGHPKNEKIMAAEACIQYADRVPMTKQLYTFAIQTLYTSFYIHKFFYIFYNI